MDKLATWFAVTGVEAFQQDGLLVTVSPTARLGKEWLKLNDVEVIPDWPPNSPDVSPIENLWTILKNKLREGNTSTVNFQPNMVENRR